MAAGLYDITNKTLGKGHFAVVKLARHCLTGELVAVKIIDKMKLKKEGLQQLGLEIKLLSRLSEKEHPNIVKLYQVIDTKTKLYLVMEYPGQDVCDLYDYIDRRNCGKGLKESEARHIFKQICSAIHYCHSLRIVHRDLKPENILIVNGPQDSGETIMLTGDGQSYPLVKLIDFGFSNQWDEGEKLRTSCGSLAYSAPEILLGDHYDGDKVDIWGLGCILYILLYGYNPFMQINDSETLIKILDCSFTTPRRPSICDSSIHLIKSLLQRDPKSRLTIQGVLDHCWLKGCHEDEEYEEDEEASGNAGSAHEKVESLIKDTVSSVPVVDIMPVESKSPVISSSSSSKVSSIHEKVIDHMVSQGMCSSKDHVESALKKTRERVNRTKSSELITSPVEATTQQVPVHINGEKLNEIKSSQDNYVTATYHLLKDKLVRELHHNHINVNSINLQHQSPQQDKQEKPHPKSRRGPRKPSIQQAPRLSRPCFGSPLRDSSNNENKCNKVNQLEVSSSEDDASFVLPLARKCSIVSEEGSCAGTDISGNDGPNEPLFEIEPPFMETSKPLVDIIITDFSDTDARLANEDFTEKQEDEIDGTGRVEGGEARQEQQLNQETNEESKVEFKEEEEEEEGEFEDNENLEKKSEYKEEASSRGLLRTSSNYDNNPLHIVSSSPELLREDDYCFNELYNSPKVHNESPSVTSPTIAAHRKNSAAMILNDGVKESKKNDIGDHVINHLSHNKSTNNPNTNTTSSSSTATSLRIIVQSKSCNNILLGDEDKSCIPSSTSTSSHCKPSRKGNNSSSSNSSGYKVSSLLKKNKSDKADCCSIC